MVTVREKTETRAVRLAGFSEEYQKRPGVFSKRLVWYTKAQIELENGRIVTYTMTDDTRKKLIARVARARVRCADGITGMTYQEYPDIGASWITNIFGGTWL